MAYDCVVWAALAVSVASGMWTIQKHHDYFRDFAIRDLWAGRIDGWLYVVNVLSTMLCLCDLVFRIGWVLDVGWTAGGGDKWAKIWLTQHLGFATIATLVHTLTNILLNREGFCRLCRQSWIPGTPSPRQR